MDLLCSNGQVLSGGPTPLTIPVLLEAAVGTQEPGQDEDNTKNPGWSERNPNHIVIVIRV